MKAYLRSTPKDAQLPISYGMHRTRFGMCVIGVAQKSVCYLALYDGKSSKVMSDFKKLWPNAEFARDDKKTAPFIKQIFTHPTAARMPILVTGTPFQEKVWKALLAIPQGKTITYAELAKKAGSPWATRAAGSACGKNNIAFIIPCHRVVASNGALGNYRWGVARKKKILAFEGK